MKTRREGERNALKQREKKRGEEEGTEVIVWRRSAQNEENSDEGIWYNGIRTG